MRRLLLKVLSFYPKKLPVGLTEFNAWSDEIVELTNFADPISLKFAIASMVIHLPANTGRVSQNHFVRGLRKSAANQVASQIFQDIKVEQETKQKQQAEAAAKQLVGTSDEKNALN